MISRTLMIVLVAGVMTMPLPRSLYSQGQRGQRGGPPPTSRSEAAFDITGYWVSVVTEDWRWRMTTPPKGDYAGVPLNAAGIQMTKDWDPAKDEAANQQCKSYGVANIMRVPERLHITWQDDQTLKIETDSGMQTRLLYFGPPRGQGGDWQGVSSAEWEYNPLGGYGARGGAIPRPGSLKVVTTKMKAGYLRKNGVPYSENSVVTEYYDRIDDPKGTFLVLTQVVEDPAYLTQRFPTTAHFRKQTDATGWNPTPCTAQ